ALHFRGSVGELVFGHEEQALTNAAKWQTYFDQAGALPLLGERDCELARRHRLAGPALRAEDADQRRRNGTLCERRPAFARDRLLQRVPDALGRLRQGDDIVGTRGEDPLHESVRIGAVELQDDDRPLRSEPGYPLEERDRASRQARAG